MFQRNQNQFRFVVGGVGGLVGWEVAGWGGVEGIVLFYNAIRMFVLCREGTKQEAILMLKKIFQS